MAVSRRSWVHLVLIIVSAIALIDILVGVAMAAEFRSGDVITIAVGEVINDDLFVSASRMVVNGTVNGDLWVVGGQLEINGTVSGSLFFAGRELRLNGDLLGSLYAVGSTVDLNPQANVARNVYLVGYALGLAPGSVVGRDVFVAGNQALIQGQVARNLNFGGSALDINGTVSGDVQAAVAAPGSSSVTPPFAGAPPAAPPGIRVSEDARIDGQLTYTSPVEQSENIRSQPAGGVVFRQAERREPVLSPGVRWVLAWLRLFASLLALGALAIWGLGAPLGALADKVYTVPLASLGWGILILLAGFAAAFVAGGLILIVGGLLAAVTLGGLAATVLFGAGSAYLFGFAVFLLAVIYGSKIVIAYLLGRLVLERLAGQPPVDPLWLLLVGVAIYSLLQVLPFFGDFVATVATLIGFGAIYLVWRDSLAPRRA